MELIRQLENLFEKNSSNEILVQFYRRIEQYVHTIPCGCGQTKINEENFASMSSVHPPLSEMLTTPKWLARMNSLDEKRQKKIVHHLETLKGWITANEQLDRIEVMQHLNKIARTLQQLAVDVRHCFHRRDLLWNSSGSTIVTRCISLDDL